MYPIKKLHKSVQLLICASNQINSFTKAVQELVFNSLDADATSIAVRINIAQGTIQVVDNGCGISQADFKYLGQNYMTSKLVDIYTLKSAPNKYGFKGQSLANLVQISETFKLTSRCTKCETTFEKTFENGKEKSTAKCSSRPSIGTTIEIKGFLHNLSIQKKSVELLNELQSIKQFLEHMSLVHTSISLSLRDDSKNEIVYNIHKNRDMYQTLSTLYEIEKNNIQELQVEKQQYKVKAYVGKDNVEISRQFIFLNGKLIPDSSKLHKRVSDHLKGVKIKIKKNPNIDGENLIFANKIQYFLFITCPYMDYELTNTVLEFRDWGQINTLVDKLVKFYMGNMQLNVAPKKHITGWNNNQTESTRNQIESIMRKILRSHTKKPEISQMQNGIKGKLIKRKLNNKKKYLSNAVDSKKKDVEHRRSKQNSSERVLIHEQQSYKNNSSLKKQCNPGNDQISKKRSLATDSTKSHVEKPNKINIQKKTNPKHAIFSKTKTQKQLRFNNNDKASKQNDKSSFKKVSLNNKFAMETESVKKRCELLAQKTKEIIKNNKRNPKIFINENVKHTRSHVFENNKNIAIHKKVNEIVIHEYIPLPPKFNKDIQIRKNQNKKSFKSNYDLLQTIICTQESKRDKQRENMNVLNDSIPAMVEPDNCKLIEKELAEIYTFQPVTPDRNRMPLFRGLDDTTSYQSETPIHNLRPFVRGVDDPTPFQELTPEYHFIKSSDPSPFHLNTHDNTPMHLFGESDNVSPLHAETLTSNILPYLIRDSDDASPFQAETFQSHNYVDQELRTKNEKEIYKVYKKPRNFITTQSRENFIEQTNYLGNNSARKNKIDVYSKLFYSNNDKRNPNKSVKKINLDNNTVKGIRESYSIEFTESNKYEYSPVKNNGSNHGMPYLANNTTCGITPSLSYILNDPRFEYVSSIDPTKKLTSNNNSENNNDLDYEPINENTFTMTNSYSNSIIEISSNYENSNNHATYTIDRTIESRKSCCESETSNIIKYTENNENNNTNFVFVSKSQENCDERIVTNPIELCEIVLKDLELSVNRAKEFNDSLNCRDESSTNFTVNNNDANGMSDLQNEFNNSMNTYFSNIVSYEKPQNQKSEEVSHHFTITNSMLSGLMQSQIISKANDGKTDTHEKNKEETIAADTMNNKNDTGAFKIQSRLFFVPKGMSPIFKERLTKAACEYEPEDDYYEDKIYNDFVDKVQNDAQVFKPVIQEATNQTTKDNKVSSKKNKDNASLKFDGLSIKNANVLGQVDSKFIAATMKGKCHESDDVEEFLVLFDQHAVHERIRLENNLADYITSSQWKSVTIDEVPLKMSRDDILYLHNYREKFKQFGLEWIILNYNEISITAIPEAILGKNPRQVDKIMKAVKNLITEEINIIQMQRGCVSLYPKSIMELVFSEACRYAIKFGDHLSKSQCAELLLGLSDCKSPFQCAHGRPAMAVIITVESNKFDYKINFDKLRKFKNCC